jgi:hypothetical protein
MFAFMVHIQFQGRDDTHEERIQESMSRSNVCSPISSSGNIIDLREK